MFRTKLVNYFAVGLLIVTTFVMGFIYYELTTTKRDLATQIITQKSERVKSELNEFFIPIQYVIRTISKQNSISAINRFDQNSLNLFYIPLIEEYPQISSMGLAHSSGYELDILPDSISGYWLNREVFVDRWGMIEKWTRWQYTSALTLIDSWETKLNVDPRERSWFKGAALNANSDIFWSDPYEYMTGNLGITSSSRFPDNVDDESFYIMALDITLVDLSNFSQKLNLSVDSQIFILTGDMSQIIGLAHNYADFNIDVMHNELLTKPQNFGNNELNKLLEYDPEQIVSFKDVNKTWWGILKKYEITNGQSIVVATLIPERDFSTKIDRTKNLMVLGFPIVLTLTLLLNRINSKLRLTGKELQQKNILIDEQKQHLLSEVHHRVKNNLAVMSALMEIENMMIDDPKTNQVLNLIHSRIMSMSAVHEVLYKSDKLNQIPVQEIMPGIIEYTTKSNTNLAVVCEISRDSVQINVNQALTYALLINEFLTKIKYVNREFKKNLKINIAIKKESDQIITTIHTDHQVDLFQDQQDIGSGLIHVLVEQLEATLSRVADSEGEAWEINFKMNHNTGITSDLNYQ